MMTNVLCAVYPELWCAATSYAGAAAGCFVDISSEFPNYQSCTVDGEQEDGDYWAAVARAMYPDYTGTYPPIQVWYGDIPEFATSEAAVSQWAAIFGYDTNNLQSQQFQAYEKFIYGPSLQGISYSPLIYPASTLTPSSFDSDLLFRCRGNRHSHSRQRGHGVVRNRYVTCAAAHTPAFLASPGAALG
jgi:hypothetical protein